METDAHGTSDGVAALEQTKGESTFIGLCESSRPFPLSLGLLRLPALLCSVDLGEGVAVDMAEQGDEATEFSCVFELICR